MNVWGGHPASYITSVNYEQNEVEDVCIYCLAVLVSSRSRSVVFSALEH
jgi:hypothetical protein